MIKDLENINNVVNLNVYNKPQDIFKYLLNGDCKIILQSQRNSKLIKRLGISSVNNSFFNPIQGA